jgi:hypothetical protein
MATGAIAQLASCDGHQPSIPDFVRFESPQTAGIRKEGSPEVLDLEVVENLLELHSRS